jgi:3-phosphoshikimate 1-carboxyvinyltransferase
MAERTARVLRARRLAGAVVVPGDKSVSHRALILASLARGSARIHGLSRGGDVRNTARAIRALGVATGPWGSEPLAIEGAGLGGWKEPAGVLDFGNSGTGIRLMAGPLAAHPFFSVLSGDRYLRRRPMRRVAEPLRLMGARIGGRAGGTLAPLAVDGTRLRGIAYASPVSSAQVKSALLLAGLLADGETAVTEPRLSRDHTERMLLHLGLDLRREGTTVAVTGGREWRARDLAVPGDPSSAAFILAAAVVAAEAEVTVRNVCVNPTRTGFFELLRAMGARVRYTRRRTAGGEPVADITASAGPLHGIDVPPALVPSTIDEFPILAAVALFASGTTRITGAAELRVKESDRIRTMAAELARLGGRVRELPDGMEIDGGAPLRGAAVRSHGDHRVAMALAVAGGAIGGETLIRDTACVATSFPEFWGIMRGLGARIATA